MGTENQPSIPASHPQPDIPPASMRTELEKQRETSARLLSDLACAISRSAGHVRRGAGSAARRTGHAAQYVQEHYMRDMATGLGRFIRRHPAPTLVAAILTGYVAARVLQRR